MNEKLLDLQILKLVRKDDVKTVKYHFCGLLLPILTVAPASSPHWRRKYDTLKKL